MPTYEAISKDNHKDKCWKPSTNYKFAAKDSICPIVAREVPKAVLNLPVAFTQLEDKIELCAVLGLGIGRNFVVDDEGNWLAGYIPAAYRGYPFALAPAKDDKQSLCIITDSLSDTEGEALFDDLGEPSERVKNILNFLSEIARNTSSTRAICTLLEKLDLFEPWTIIVQNDETERELEGLIRISEAKFNALEAEAFLELREQGALPLVYSQLLSMQNLNKIAKIAQLTQSPNKQPTLPEELPFDFSNDQGNISFDSLL